ncbi:hypothetical protein [Paludibaculum fermentans]|uniref:Flagellar basal-body/hook protein C-terminal domain-containing protein n=1 Tax=Paludibaculum fermentans TaxID=1473598 RepID=A0A7S7NKT8_PALFE|nr:hypothetical protein [Paludibaculum fermentans]QOY85487.1 hypothetical protein IRI77_21960 [Paludibaculum fermentans]
MADLSIALAGINNGLELAGATAARIAKMPTVASAPTDTVDLSAEAVAMMQAKIMVDANVQVAQNFDNLNQAILSILA